MSDFLFLAGGCGSIFLMKAFMEKKIKKVSDLAEKHLTMFFVANKWVNLKQEGKSLAPYLEKSGYKNIAIYGMSYLGESLIHELDGTGIKVIYGIDKNVDGLYESIRTVTPEEDLIAVDAVIVTAVTFFDEIKSCLQKKVKCPILSLEDILYEL